MIISIGSSIYDTGDFNVILHCCIDNGDCEVGSWVLSSFWGGVEGMVKEGGQKVSEVICVVVFGWEGGVFLDGRDGVLQVFNLLVDVYCLLVIGNYHRRLFL